MFLFVILFFSGSIFLPIHAADTSSSILLQPIDSNGNLVNKKKLPYHQLDLPGTNKDAVDTIRKQYLKPNAAKNLAKLLEDGEQYRLYVRKQLLKNHMPAALEYLPIVESSYIPYAISKDGKGVGLWQFIPNSTAPFLIRNEWIDERFDPWKETDAALAKLKDNYNVFHDWLLAIGAYNCGAGAMKRALEKAPEKNFWYLADHKMIPDHTIRYVPKLLAIADLVTNASYYGVSLPAAADHNKQLLMQFVGEFDYITVNTSIHLHQLARELRIDENYFLQLNPSLIKEVTPPNQQYFIRLPLGMKDAAEHALCTINAYSSSFIVKKNRY